MCSRLSRNAETGGSDKEALFASAGGVEVSEFLGGETRQATRGARRWSWTFLELKFMLSYLLSDTALYEECGFFVPCSRTDEQPLLVL